MATPVSPQPFIPGARLIDGTDLNAQLASSLLSSQTGITAKAGGGQTSATQLVASLSNVTTVATAGDSVKLPSAKVGLQVTVANASSLPMQVFGYSTDTVNSVATATGVSQPAQTTVIYRCFVAGNWIGTPVFSILKTTAAVTKNASVAYGNVTGQSFTVVPGTYAFQLYLPSTVASGTGGIKYAFNYTTAVLSALEATSRGFTASAVAVQHTTTTTTQTDLFTQAAVVIFTEISGTMVVTTGGTVDVQVAQNTSNASDTVALVGGYGQFIKIA